MPDRNGYIGRAPSDSSVTVARQSYTASGITTDFTFSSGYTPGYFDIYINGVKMIEGSDYTSSDGSTFSILNGGASDGDALEAVAYKAFNASAVSSAADFTVSGNLTVNGTASFAGSGTSVSFATTAFNLSGTPDIAARNITGTGATFTGDVNIGGVLSYEDVQNIDAVGLITARGGLDVTGGNVTIGTGSTVGFGSTAYFRDNAKAIFGDDEDLQIYHDGSDSIVKDSGTGRLKLLSNIVDLKNTADTEVLGRFTSGGSVDLRYDHSTKFETTNDGVVITGIATANNVSVSSSVTAATFYGSGQNLTNLPAGGDSLDVTASLFI